MSSGGARFDAARYKADTREQWRAAAAAWHRWGPTLSAWLGAATERMLGMAGVEEGSRVLDVAAGAGEQTLRVARWTGPSGRVLATDICPDILAFAAASARAAGLMTVETRVMDGERLELDAGSFDVVISRLGLMYFPDQQGALRGMRRVLAPGGRVAAMVYSTPERNPSFSGPLGIVRRRAATPPAPGQPGPFSLGAPAALGAALAQAGFVEVRTCAVSAPLRLPSAAACLRFEREAFGALHQMLSSLGAAEQEAAWSEIAEHLRTYEGRDGFVAPCEVVVGVGTA
jgi:SAM-dependent methyltransferase